MDLLEASARILSLASCGASPAKIIATHQHLRQGEARWLLKMLVDKNMLEVDSSAAYWTTVNGVKFLEIQFHMVRILQAQKSLI